MTMVYVLHAYTDGKTCSDALRFQHTLAPGALALRSQRCRHRSRSVIASREIDDAALVFRLPSLLDCFIHVVQGDTSAAQNESSASASASAGSGDRTAAKRSSGMPAKTTARQPATSAATGSKGTPVARANAAGDAALRRAVGRACQDVLAGIFSSSVATTPSASGSGPTPSPLAAPANQTELEAEEECSAEKGSGIDGMDVEEGGAGPSLPAAAGAPVAPAADTEGALAPASVAAPQSELGDGGSNDMQAVLCGLLRMSIVVAGSPAAAAAAAAAGKGPGAAAAAAAGASAAAAAMSESAGLPSSSGFANHAGSGSTAAASPSAMAASAAPLLLVERQWRTEHCTDPDEEELETLERANATRNSSSAADSDTAAAAAVVRAVAGSSGGGDGSGGGAGAQFAAGGATAGGAPNGGAPADSLSPDTLQSIMALLLGGSTGVAKGARTTRVVPRRGTGTKDRNGPGDTAASIQGRKNSAGKTSSGDGAAKKRGRSSSGGGRRNDSSGKGSGGDGNEDGAQPAAMAAAAAPTSSTSKVAGSTTKAVCRTATEGLMRLNAILRTPSLAVLASTVQLATVRVAMHSCFCFEAASRCFGDDSGGN